MPVYQIIRTRSLLLVGALLLCLGLAAGYHLRRSTTPPVQLELICLPPSPTQYI